MLSDSDSDSNDLHTLIINEHFAKAFEYKKEREELAKLKEKYGSDFGSRASDGGDSDGSEDTEEDSDGSEDTEEDSDGEELTPAVDAAILRTLALIKKRDPTIYEGERRVFEEEHTRTQDKAPAKKSKTKEKSKPLTVREAVLASALAEADPHSRFSSVEPLPLTHTEEQALLRSETRAAFHGVIDSEEGDDDLLVPRSRTRDEIELEEEEYKAFLEREVGEDIHNLITVETNEGSAINNVQTTEGDEKERKKKRRKERAKEREEIPEKYEGHGRKTTKQRNEISKEEADQEFLMNYIFNRGWMDRSNRRVPTYNEILESSSKKSKRRPLTSQADSDVDSNMNENSDNEQLATLSDENSFEDLADAFETSYNFRFEEPGGALISSFPRNAASARRQSTTRKDARARKKERQEAEKRSLLEARREEVRRERTLAEATVAQEDEGAFPVQKNIPDKDKSKKQQRKEELTRMRALKAKELRRKLEMVNSEGGLSGLGGEVLARLDLDTDWDASKHDAQMAELYGGMDDIADDGDDAKKPTWDDDINIDDVEPPSTTSKKELKKQKKKEKKKNKKADEDVGVDLDEMDADIVQDDWNVDEEWKGTEEERKRKVDAYMDEVVNRLGFSTITSHMPTRFYYTSTTPENYGLTPAEILLATDVELNSYVGLKKLAPYRVDKGGKAKKSWDPKRTERLKDFREQLRSRVGSGHGSAWSVETVTGSKSGAAGVQGEKNKRKGKKERVKLRARQGEDDADQPEAAGKSQKRKLGFDGAASHLTEAELDAKDGAQKKRRRRRHKKGSGGVDEGTVVS